jgi:TusA-related sulfurtransferase
MSPVVDVRDMLCAQALAEIAQAAARLSSGQTLMITYNAEDVKQDAARWAHHQGYRLEEEGPASLRLTVGNV